MFDEILIFLQSNYNFDTGKELKQNFNLICKVEEKFFNTFTDEIKESLKF